MRQISRRVKTAWTIGLLTALLVWVPQFLVPGLYDRANNLIFDAYQQYKPRKWTNSSVVVLDIDEASIERIGQWPWPRDFMAELTDRLGKLGAATIVYDVVFSEPDRTSPIKLIDRLQDAGVNVELPDQTGTLDNDKLFAEAIGRNQVVTGLVLAQGLKKNPPLPKAGFGVSGTIPPQVRSDSVGAIRNLSVFDEAASGIGVFSLASQDVSDGIIRQVRLLQEVDGNFYPTLGLEALRVAQGAGGYKIKSSDGSGEVNIGEVRLTSLQAGALTIPTGAFGEINIYHSLIAAKPDLSVQSLMFPDEVGVTIKDLKAQVEGKIVLIGTSAAGLLDLRATAIESVVPGVFIHADIIDQLISGTFLKRPDTAKGMELVVAILSVLLMLLITPHVNALIGGIATLVICCATVWFFWTHFSQNLTLYSPLLTLVSVIAAYVTSSSAQFLVSQKEGAFLRNAFGQYLSPTLVDRLTKNPDQLVLGGETKELTVLFCDIRGFTSLSENLDPTELTNLLNNFLTPMTAILLNNGATIDKYMGDAIMAFWNAPIDQENHRELACRSVLEMRTALQRLNDERTMNLQIGTGLNTGPSCVGNLGSDQRFSYSAIGDAVNVASRIEGLTKQYGLDNLASGETIKSGDGFQFMEIDLVGVVGRAEPLSVYHVVDHMNETESFDFKVHEEFISTYRCGDIKHASSLLKTLLDTAPEEFQKVYSIYADRLTDLKRNGIPKDWNGVFIAQQK